MNETLKAIKERISCRSFSDKTPEDHELRSIAETDTHALSGMDRQA